MNIIPVTIINAPRPFRINVSMVIDSWSMFKRLMLNIELSKKVNKGVVANTGVTKVIGAELSAN